MEFAYTQAGQENSFTWDGMGKGLEMQMPLIAKLRSEKKVKVETLAASGHIHLFNEKLSSIYETQKATSNECSFFTLYPL